MLLWLNNSSIWGLEDMSSGNETWVLLDQMPYLPPRILCQSSFNYMGGAVKLRPYIPPAKSHFYTSHHFHIQWVAYLITWTGRLEKGRRRGAERELVLLVAFILGENGSFLHESFISRGIAAIFGACCLLLASLRPRVPPADRHRLPSSLVCDIDSALRSPEWCLLWQPVGCLRC